MSGLGCSLMVLLLAAAQPAAARQSPLESVPPILAAPLEQEARQAASPAPPKPAADGAGAGYEQQLDDELRDMD
jgi:hypothetical protein